LLKLNFNFYRVPAPVREESEMDTTGSCEFETLAEGHACRVERCAHGMIHVSIGGVTLRLQASHCYDLTRTLRAASARIDAAARPAAAPRQLC
jgi:hypothetical protein